MISKDAREYHIADSAAPITDDGERLRGVVLVFRDVTEIVEIHGEIEVHREPHTVFTPRFKCLAFRNTDQQDRTFQ